MVETGILYNLTFYHVSGSNFSSIDEFGIKAQNV